MSGRARTIHLRGTGDGQGNRPFTTTFDTLKDTPLMIDHEAAHLRQPFARAREDSDSVCDRLPGQPRSSAARVHGAGGTYSCLRTVSHGQGPVVSATLDPVRGRSARWLMPFWAAGGLLEAALGIRRRDVAMSSGPGGGRTVAGCGLWPRPAPR